MTALSEYQRLECEGLWREGPSAQRREVVVSFGEASLVITDRNDVALAHWSLPAVERMNGSDAPAIYAPSPEGGETLEIEDRDMIAAIEKVRAAIARRRPHPGRLRLVVLATIAAGLAALAVFWLPGALVRHAVGVVPEAKRAEIGRGMLDSVAALAGRPCRNALGTAALTRLRVRLMPDAPRGARIAVLPGLTRALHLPGGSVLLPAALIEDHEGPEVAAAQVVLEGLRAARRDPLARLLESAGTMATFRLLTTGQIAPALLASHAEHLVTAPPDPPPDDAGFLAALAAAGVPSTPYAYAQDVSGETVLGLIEADPFRAAPAPPLLTDGEWVGLQGICGG
jgi:hypothetical protein